MTDLPMMLCSKIVNRLIAALEQHATTANITEVQAGIKLLDTYRRACKGGEWTEAERKRTVTAARESLQAWAESRA